MVASTFSRRLLLLPWRMNEQSGAAGATILRQFAEPLFAQLAIFNQLARSMNELTIDERDPAGDLPQWNPVVRTTREQLRQDIARRWNDECERNTAATWQQLNCRCAISATTLLRCPAPGEIVLSELD